MLRPVRIELSTSAIQLSSVLNGDIALCCWIFLFPRSKASDVYFANFVQFSIMKLEYRLWFCLVNEYNIIILQA